jgi:hypothetical protein
MVTPRFAGELESYVVSTSSMHAAVGLGAIAAHENVVGMELEARHADHVGPARWGEVDAEVHD